MIAQNSSSRSMGSRGGGAAKPASTARVCGADASDWCDGAGILGSGSLSLGAPACRAATVRRPAFFMAPPACVPRSPAGTGMSCSGGGIAVRVDRDTVSPPWLSRSSRSPRAPPPTGRFGETRSSAGPVT